jgi:hypothetical protein
MELFGSSYLLHDVEPVRLVGTLGSWTDSNGLGSIRVSFHQNSDIFSVVRGASECDLIAKWDIALRLMTLVHILVVQNKILRNEPPELRVATDKARVLRVTGGWRLSPIVCSWGVANGEIECNQVGDEAVDQFELVLKEEVAVELVMALAERVALNGTTRTRNSG